MHDILFAIGKEFLLLFLGNGVGITEGKQMMRLVLNPIWRMGMLVTADQKTKPLIKTLAADGDVICWQVNFQNYLGELLAKLGQTMGTVLLASIFRVNGKVLHITKITVIPIENQAKKGVVFPNPNAIEVGAGCHSLSMIFLQSKLTDWETFLI